MVTWPEDEERLSTLRRGGVPRVVLVPQGVAPPLTSDVLEDWVRLPATDDDVRSRQWVLEGRMRAADSVRVPEIDASGLLRLGERWVSLPPVEQRLVAALLDRYRAVISRDALTRAGWPEGTPGRNVLDVHIVRLRRRLATVGLVIRTVRSRGYLLEEARLGTVSD